MFNITLYQPEIPPNTGNIMRLCVNTGCKLHLIKPLGFSLSDKHVKRANLDYEMSFSPTLHESFEGFEETQTLSSIYLCSTKATTRYTDIAFKPGDAFVFGPETRGIPSTILERYPESQKILIPMKDNSRSINLANSVSIVVYEAWRQQQFQ